MERRGIVDLAVIEYNKFKKLRKEKIKSMLRPSISALININGNLEVLRVVDPEHEEFVVQRCIFQNLPCGIFCPAFSVSYSENLIQLHCIHKNYYIDK